MNSTISDLVQGFVGVAAFSLMFLGPGYLWARLANIADFRRRTRAEQILWTVALSLPLGTAICALLGHVVSAAGINVIFAVLDLAAAALWWHGRAAQKTEAVRPLSRAVFVLMLLFGAFCLLATVDVQIGPRIFPSSVVQDWSVRVQMVKAAVRSGVPPINGLSTFGAGPNGQAPHLRYYYFWYVVVAQMARTFHLQAGAALAASCAWAGWGLMATFFLALKYMAGIREDLQKKCLLGLLVIAVLGLDILPTAFLWVTHRYHPYPEMEWWHQDRTPSFLSAVLYAPHHIAGFCCLQAGFLVLLVNARLMAERYGFSSSRGQTVAAALFAGICFAAASGTATFPTFCFAIVLTLWAVDLLRRKDWQAIVALAAAGAIALVFAHGYLKELSGGSSAAGGFATWAWRNDQFIADRLSGLGKLQGHGALFKTLVRQPVVLLLDFFDLGFYTLVLVHQVRRDFFSRIRLDAGACALWALLLGAALPFMFLSSTVTSGPNDLGVDAGFLLRFGLQLWAVPWVWQLWKEWRTGAPSTNGERKTAKPVMAAAAILFVLGLSAQVYQVLSIRFYYALVGSGAAHKQMDAFTLDRLGERLYNIRSAWREFDAKVPPSSPDTEAVQFNPIGAMQPAETLYSSHQIASWDTGCGTSYGGDYPSCAPVYQGLLYLFGNTQAGFVAGRAQNDRQDGAAAGVATAADFTAMCRTLHIRAIMAESTDSIWKHRDSWVWQEPVMAANETVRILGCPAS